MMRNPFLKSAKLLLTSALAISITPVEVTHAAFLFGDATEWTQVLNNLELVGLTGQSAEQIQNQITQITQQAEQIQTRTSFAGARPVAACPLA